MPKSAASSSTTAIHAVRLYGGYPMASTLSSFPRLDCQLSGNCATPHCRPLAPIPKPRWSVTLRAAYDCGLRHGSGQHCECPSSPRAQGKARSRECRYICAYAYVGTSVEPSGFDNARLDTSTHSLSASRVAPIPRFTLCSDTRKSPFTAPSAYSPRLVRHALRITAHRKRRLRRQKAVQPQKSISASGNFDFHGSDLTAQCAYSEGAKGCGSRYKSARWGLPEGSTGASPRTP